MSSLLVRTLSSLVLAPIVLAAVYFGGYAFWVFLIVASILSFMEWGRMCRSVNTRNTNERGSWNWFIPGFLYILVAMASLYWLRLPEDSGQIMLFWLFALVWSADTGAYLAGSTIGGPKFAPKVSPKKTWAGFIGALISAGIVGAVSGYILNDGSIAISLVICSVVIGGLSQLGDLLESYAKRHFGVKDSGAIIPGHGGILDRIDGLMAAAIGAAIAVYFNLGLNLSWG